MTYSDLTRRVERELKRIRRKQQLKGLAIMLVLLLVFGAVLYLLGVHVARPWLDKLDNFEAAALIATTTVTIEPGDTLWHIARERYPSMDPREAIYNMRLLNPGLDPGGLQVGQKIVIPEVD